jgi:CheY-like chemotaxis protein
VVDGSHSRLHPRVLLVEDDPVSSYAIEHDLRACGAEVLIAQDGRAALRILTDEILTLDLLVTDLEMPELDGLALVRTIRADGGEADLPVLVIGDDISLLDEQRLKEFGASVIPKVAGLDAVVAEAHRMLGVQGWVVGDPEPRVGPIAALARSMKRPA